jgi:hypothetical protein
MSTNPHTAHTVDANPAGDHRSRWIYLKSLTLPLELSRQADEFCRKFWFWERGRIRRQVEEELKLRHFFGGRTVRYLKTDNGVAVVADANWGEAAYHQAVDALTPQERQRAVVDAPALQSEEECSCIPSLIPNDQEGPPAAG